MDKTSVKTQAWTRTELGPSHAMRALLNLTVLGCSLAFAPPKASYLPSARAPRAEALRGSLTLGLACNADGAWDRADRRSALGAAAAAWFVAGGHAGAAVAEDEARSTPTQDLYTPGKRAPWEGVRKPVPVWELDGSVKMPTLALNTVALSVEDTVRAVNLALASGITHIDFHPGKERDGVASVLASGVPPSRLFLTTKIKKAPPGTTPADAATMAQTQIREDLETLGLDSVDMLMLRDSPDKEVIQAQWKVLEAARASGQCRAIGVINFCEGALESLLETATVTPAVNYIMLHVGMGSDAHGLRSYGESKGIRTFAYGAIGEPAPSQELLASSTVRKISTAVKRSPAEVCARWVLQTGVALSVRPSADFALGRGPQRPGIVIRSGIKQRAELFSWSLTDDQMTRLSAMKAPDGNPTLFSSDGCPGNFQMPK